MLLYLLDGSAQLAWYRLRPFEELAEILLDDLDGILKYCRTKVPSGHGRSRELQHQVLRRGRGYKNLRYLLLKAQQMAATRPREEDSIFSNRAGN